MNALDAPKELIMPPRSNINKRIAKNTLLLYFRMLFMMVVSLYMSESYLMRWEWKTLEYIIWYNMVGGVVAMLSYMTTLELFVTKIM